MALLALALTVLTGCASKDEPDTTGPVLPPAPPIPAVDPVPAPAGADAIARAGDEGMRFGYNDVLTSGSQKIGLLAGSGSDTARMPMSWNAIQPQTGAAFDWSRFDGLYTQLLQQGIRPLWSLVDAPCWAGDARIPCDPSTNRAGAPGPEHANDFASFAAAVAERYPESLGIEVGNEVNDPTFWPNGQDPGVYAGLLGVTAAALDEVDPDMPLVAAGLSPIAGPKPGELTWRTYLNVMLADGAAEYVDAFAFHPYVRTAPSEDAGPVVGALVDKFLRDLDRRGAGDKPLWITEVGLSTATRPPRTPEEQATGLVSILGQLQQRGIPVAIIHRLVDEASAQFPQEAGAGVIGADNMTRKPAFCAVATYRGVPCT